MQKVKKYLKLGNTKTVGVNFNECKTLKANSL